MKPSTPPGVSASLPHPAPGRIRRHADSESAWDGDPPCEDHETEEEGVIGESEKPAPPSEKPQAC